MLYNAGLEPIESMLVKKVGSLSLGCSPFLFFFILLCSKLYATYAIFFRLVYRCFVVYRYRYYFVSKITSFKLI